MAEGFLQREIMETEAGEATGAKEGCRAGRVGVCGSPVDKECLGTPHDPNWVEQER